MKTKMAYLMVGAMAVILLTAGAGYADLNDGLVAYYPFDGNANDASGNGNHGTLYGATFGSGLYGQALSLDGMDSYVEVPDAPEFDVTTAVTMSAFVYPLSLSGYWGKMIFYRRQIYDYRNQFTFDIRTDTGLPLATLEFSNGETAFIYGSESLAMNGWYHLAVVYDGRSLRMYVDGHLSSVETKTVQGTALNGQTIVSSAYPLAIGRSYDGPDPAHVYYRYYYEDNFHGGIDDARLYARALSADEISGLINPPPVVEDLYLHGVAPALTLNDIVPPGTVAKYKDSPSVNRTAFKEIGTWRYVVPAGTTLQIDPLTDIRAWVGLKNSDDQGTYFDIRAELLKNGTPVASGETQNVQGVTRNPDKAKEVVVPFGTISDRYLASGDVLSLRILTKVTATGGHSSAVGLRLYYDSVSRPSRFEPSSIP